MTQIHADMTVDARGLSCPIPIVRTKKAMDALQPDQVLEVLATDKGSCKDVPAWARTTGNQILATSEQDGVFRFYIRKS